MRPVAARSEKKRMNDRTARKGTSVSRRSFLTSAAAAGTGMLLSPVSLETTAASKAEYINVGLIGAGTQGQLLLETCLKMPGIHFCAVCDIWADYNQRRASDTLREHRHPHGIYLDYRQMLDVERALDAVIIATPDFWHAEQTVACLKAGLHVYCEAPMSNTLEGARKMAQAARETGKLLQIGHQRRSNAKYLHCCEKLLKEVKLLGKLTAANAQWNRSVQPDRGWPRRYPIDDATLARYGFESMQQFRNWQSYKSLGSGPLMELGCHQVDVFNWFLDARPKSVIASGGIDYYDPKTHHWPDTVMAVYEYETRRGTVRAFYQTINSNSSNGYFEAFMGPEGTLTISEAPGQCKVYREASAPDWDRWVRLGFLVQPGKEGERAPDALLEVGESVRPPSYTLPVKFDEPNHKPHLENFFDAIRGTATLNCPAGIAYDTFVTVFKVNEAIETGRKLSFSPDEFEL